MHYLLPDLVFVLESGNPELSDRRTRDYSTFADLSGLMAEKRCADDTAKRSSLSFGPGDPACKHRVYGVYIIMYTL